MAELIETVSEIKKCQRCIDHLPRGPKPILQLHQDARILIAGQAPGRHAHEAGIPFADASGERLRKWLKLPPHIFYDPTRIAILPMGFCYPGTSKSGDLPPRPECASTWRSQILQQLHNVQLTLVIGQYAKAYHLPDATGSLTEIIQRWHDTWPQRLCLPHPSPRNNLWLKRNPWFEAELLPVLQNRIADLLADIG